jgi:UDP-2-acetamido-3-amino-2,3-dideoxy-glucuronate N-acetyltransferase
VISDVKPYALMVGNPAKQKGWYSEEGHRLQFDSDGLAICKNGERYQLKDENVIKL